jgi:hypothetical protein
MTAASFRFSDGSRACCRELQPILWVESVQALDVIERFAYGRASFDELVDARRLAKSTARRVARYKGMRTKEHAANEAVRDAGRNDGAELLSLVCWRLKRAKLSVHRQAEIFERVAIEWAAECNTAAQRPTRGT